MKYLNVAGVIAWTFLASVYGSGEVEPDKFMYTTMAGLLALQCLINFIAAD